MLLSPAEMHWGGALPSACVFQRRYSWRLPRRPVWHHTHTHPPLFSTCLEEPHQNVEQGKNSGRLPADVKTSWRLAMPVLKIPSIGKR